MLSLCTIPRWAQSSYRRVMGDGYLYLAARSAVKSGSLLAVCTHQRRWYPVQFFPRAEALLHLACAIRVNTSSSLARLRYSIAPSYRCPAPAQDRFSERKRVWTINTKAVQHWALYSAG